MTAAIMMSMTSYSSWPQMFNNFASNPDYDGPPGDPPNQGVVLPITKEARDVLRSFDSSYAKSGEHRGYTISSSGQLFECYGKKTNGRYLTVNHKATGQGGFSIIIKPGEEPSLTGGSGSANPSASTAMAQGALRGVVRAALDRSSEIYDYMSNLASFDSSEPIFSSNGADLDAISEGMVSQEAEAEDFLDLNNPDISVPAASGASGGGFLIAITGQSIGEVRDFDQNPVFNSGSGGNTASGGSVLSAADTLNGVLQGFYDLISSSGSETEHLRRGFIDNISNILDALGRVANISESVGDFFRNPLKNLAGGAFDVAFQTLMGRVPSLVKAIAQGIIDGAKEAIEKERESDNEESSDSTSKLELPEDFWDKKEEHDKKFLVTSTHESSALVGNVADVLSATRFIVEGNELYGAS